jgi:hypothetical protein
LLLAVSFQQQICAKWRRTETAAFLAAHRESVSTVMFRRIIQALPRGVRGLIQPRYRPERHYMRGYGPACAAREAAARV